MKIKQLLHEQLRWLKNIMQLFFGIYINWHSNVSGIFISTGHCSLQDTLNYSTLVF